MTDFTNQIRTMIKEVIIKELGIKNEEIKSSMSLIVEKKVNEQLVAFLTEEKVAQLVETHVDRHIRGMVASKFRWSLDEKVAAAFKKLAEDIEISFTTKEKSVS